MVRVGGGGGSSAHEAKKKAARRASDNENFINEKLSQSYPESDSLPIIKSLFVQAEGFFEKSGTNTIRHLPSESKYRCDEQFTCRDFGSG